MTTFRNFDMPARLDHEGARKLYAGLTTLRGENVRLNARDTTFLGALGLQILVAAARQWRVDGRQFCVSPHSPAFADDLVRLGADLHDLNEDQP